MVIDFNWAGGLVVGLSHTDEAIVEIEEGEFEFCSAVLIHLGFFTIALLFV
jgi:phage I-like protein